MAWLGSMKAELDTANNTLVTREENTNHLIDTVRNLIQENNEMRETTNAKLAELERNQRDIRVLLETMRETHAENSNILILLVRTIGCDGGLVTGWIYLR